MKRILIQMLLSFLPFFTVAQVRAQKLKRVTDKSLVTILCSTDTIIYRHALNFRAGVYVVGNGYGSANTPETDEVSYRLYIAVSSHDDAPEQHLFIINNLYNPRIVSFQKQGKNKLVLKISYGYVNSRKFKTIEVTEHDVK
jgi:hypothetical protein